MRTIIKMLPPMSPILIPSTIDFDYLDKLENNILTARKEYKNQSFNVQLILAMNGGGLGNERYEFLDNALFVWYDAEREFKIAFPHLQSPEIPRYHTTLTQALDLWISDNSKSTRADFVHAYLKWAMK